jgi:hypothetical protein
LLLIPFDSFNLFLRDSNAELAQNLYERGKMYIREMLIDGSLTPPKKRPVWRQYESRQKRQVHGN